MFVQLRMFQLEDLGLVQKWIVVLLGSLALYDDPLYLLKGVLSQTVYTCYRAAT